ncbi:MAG: hypothetical protein IPM34_04090 [Saprospiraceae bacterium]|nr:hypothetical protein [Saprospiraceae bacterium]
MKYFILSIISYLYLGMDLLHAQAIVEIPTDRTVLNIGKYVECYVDSSATQTISSILSNKRNIPFLISKQDVPNIGITKSVLWMRFKLINPHDQDCYLEISNNGLDSIFLYEVSGESILNTKESGVGLSIYERELHNNNYLLLLCNKTDTAKEFYLKVRHSRGTIVPIKVGTLKGFAEVFHKEDFMMGIYIGFMFLMILYNLILYFSVKDTSYIYYVIYVFFMAFMNASLSGYAHEYLWGDYAWLGQYEDVISSLLGISGILFAIHFLHTKQNAPVIHYAFVGLLVLFSFNMAIVLSGNFMLGTIYVEIAALLLICIFFIGAIRVLQSGYKPAKFFLFAWTALLSSLVVFILKDFNLIPYNAITGHSLKFGSATEALLLLLALANKLNTINKEKEDAQLDALQQLKDNEIIIQSQNIMLESKVKERTQELALEKKKTDELLLNILPEETADELKQSGSAKAKRYDSVTVMFTDFQNFTKTSEQLAPEELVQEINRYYIVFDNIISKYPIEKIKTIGDSYMCVGGLPTANASHAHDIVQAALEFQKFMETNKRELSAKGLRFFELRIGIHTGPVVAGIVGIRKFAYDIWGDTVNIASRMESSGEIGKVNVSGTTYELIKDQFNCFYRGKIEAKHKGQIDMYFVEEKAE